MVALFSNLKEFEAALDTCSTYSIITPKIVDGLGIEINYNSLFTLKAANTTPLQVIGTCEIEIKLGHKLLNIEFKVATELQLPCIIGADAIKRYGIVPNLKRKFFYYDDQPNTRYEINSTEGLISFLVVDRPSGDFSNGSKEKQIEDPDTLSVS